MRIAIVGAGISGLTAAHELTREGHAVTVFEASDRVGGRIHTATVNGCTVEAGANFITDAYRIVPALARDVGLAPRRVQARSSILLQDGLHTFDLHHPMSIVQSGLLTPGQVISSLLGLARLGATSRGRGTTDPRDWGGLDDLTGDAWTQTTGLAALHERSWRPAYPGFYFHDSASSSASALAAMTAHGVRQETQTFAGGLSSVTVALASHLDVRLSTAVTRVEERDGGVVLRTSAGDIEADAAILAIPGPALRGVLDLDATMQPLADVPYSVGLLALIGLTRRLRPEELDGAYGVLCAPGCGPVAAYCVASRAGHAAAERDVVTVMLAPEVAGEAMDAAEGHVLALARAELTRLAPTIADAWSADEDCRVVRIRHAMPVSEPGRVAQISRYRAAARGRRIVIAGDSHAWPWTDSAADAGRWAARTVAGRAYPAGRGAATSRAAIRSTMFLAATRLELHHGVTGHVSTSRCGVGTWF